MACRPRGSGHACAHRLARAVPAWLLSLIVGLLAPSLATAQDSGSSDRELRELALSAIPWRALSAEEVPLVSQTVRGSSLYRQLPTRLIDCDPEMFTHLVSHPDFVVQVWRELGISKLKVQQVGPGRYQVADAAGASGTVSVFHCTGGARNGRAQPLVLLARADGAYDAPGLPKPLSATSLMLLRADFFTESNGRHYVKARLDSFVRFDQPAAALVAKTLQPLVMKTADRNFVETMRFVSVFSRTAETNPKGVRALVDRMPNLGAGQRAEFLRVCDATAQRNQLRQQAQVWVTPVRQTSAAGEASPRR